MSLTNVVMHLDMRADKVVLHDANGPYPALQFGSEFTMLLEQAPTATMQAIIDRLTEAVEARETAAEVPSQVAAEDGIRFIGVPYQRTGRAA
ncbi:hypothetical protein [Streptomyces sp. B1I3]|uniref:hypothetical protein n=1 Tax=Streptomyces sp. B1I3 TaxID=3042264 RepID=UPI0027853C0E|nr:hypothetical protein [Streptomyces sp. B1I3]MDQ0792057.1 hypothetical protein [Streptomyces sp. B1I3]